MMELIMLIDLRCRRIGCFIYGHVWSRVGRDAQLCVRCVKLKGELRPEEVLTVEQIMEMRH